MKQAIRERVYSSRLRKYKAQTLYHLNQAMKSIESHGCSAVDIDADIDELKLCLSEITFPTQPETLDDLTAIERSYYNAGGYNTDAGTIVD